MFNFLSSIVIFQVATFVINSSSCDIKITVPLYWIKTFSNASIDSISKWLVGSSNSNSEFLKSRNEYAGTYFQSFKKVITLFSFDNNEKQILKKCATLTKTRNLVVLEYETLIYQNSIKDYKEIIEWYFKFLEIMIFKLKELKWFSKNSLRIFLLLL